MQSGLTSTVRNHLKTVVDIFYPLQCGGCGDQGSTLCGDCIGSFRAVDEGSSCPVCGRWIGTNIVCGGCLEENRGFQEGHYGFYFEGRLRNAVHAFKFNGRKDIGRRLVSLLKEKILSLAGSFDCVVPVPVTEKRLKERGFNQSFIIAEEIAKIAGREIGHSVLLKKKDTKDQYSLTREDRQRNVRGVFAVQDREKIRGKRVLLVDDLFTTGYTAREAALTLLRSHAGEVRFFALARTPS
jgi:competence protein ComFC